MLYIGTRTFAEKYNLVGRGQKVVISQRTKDIIDSLNRQSEYILARGREYVKQEKRVFGVNKN